MNRSEMLRRLKAGEDALELSIEKWQDIVDGKGLDSCRENCALCEVHRLSEDEEYKQPYPLACGECPVKLRTGHPFCQNSPWIKVDSDSKESEQVELEFLKGLRKRKQEAELK